ncbi:ligand-binding sensor domain-containing protein [Catalinimonas alkaloidigena]|uniref:histidine kinase n=1 Tax=Catalinimonas alkaloidigena TaxID=1075417 RepID=A0A1G9HHU4_9BACT|nr:two-component regulator propeller domain-containing protein [Catalinimonas alkaloidigena]SDL12530.1 ligand-binding sensor domain-containing protein [Catalinimonas alkaloidigena]
MCPPHIASFVRVAVLLLFGAGWNVALPGQPLRFRHLSTGDGLSQSSVLFITQDAQGFLWFGTHYGLNRYDGYAFKVFHHREGDSTSLAHNEITSLFTDREGVVWVGTHQGLSRYDRTQEQFRTFRPQAGEPNHLPALTVHAMTEDENGTLWLGTALGLSRRDGEHFRNYLPQVSVQALLSDGRGGLWIGTGTGLLHFDPSSGTLQTIGTAEAELPASDVRALCFDAEGQLWIGTYGNGLYRLAPEQNRLERYRHRPDDPNSLIDHHIRSLCLDKRGDLWIGTLRGLNRRDRATGTFTRFTSDVNHPEGLSHSSIHALYADRQGSLWIGTYYGGINLLNPLYNRFTYLQHQADPNSLSNNVVSTLREDEAGNLWIGTEGGGLNLLDRETGRFTHFTHQPDAPGSLSHNNVKSLLLDRTGGVWVGTYWGGLNYRPPGAQEFQHYQHETEDTSSLSHSSVYALLEDRNGTLWVGAYGGGVDRLDRRTGAFTHYRHDKNDPHSLSSDVVRTLLEDRLGLLWIGTRDGLNCLDPRTGRVTVFRHDPATPTSLSRDDINTLYETRDGASLWVGTYGGGLNRFDRHNATFRHYQTGEGLPGDVVYGILEDDRGYLWISTNHGLSRFDPQTETFQNFELASNYFGNEFTSGACLRRRDGTMLFGGLNGILMFHPDSLRPDPYTAPLVLTDFRLFNRSVSVSHEGPLPRPIGEVSDLTLSHRQSIFSLSFASLNFVYPEKTQYAYRLRGLEAQWNRVTGKPTATYTNLEAGTYQFEVKAANHDGVWNEAAVPLTITVLPPPWKTGWAYLLYAVALAGAIFYLRKHLLFQQRLQNHLRLEQFKREQHDKLHQLKLRFFTNVSHEFRTPLTLLLGPLEEMLDTAEGSYSSKRKLQLMKRNADRLLHLTNQLMDFRKMESEHMQLRAASGNVVRFVQEVMLSFQEYARQRQITYAFQTNQEDVMLWYDRDKLEKVLYNLLSNAFKFTPDGGQIGLEVEAQEETVRLRVKDTGRGIAAAQLPHVFERYYEGAHEEAAWAGTGIGLALTKGLVELHRGTIAVASEVGRGTCFTVTLPRGDAHLRADEKLPDFKDSEDERHYRHVPLEVEATPLPEEEPATEVPTSEAERPLLLLVEDNSDVRSYLRHHLASAYRIREATDGEMGYEAALDCQPDLIISDVMMPHRNGIELCRQLKTDVQTSHIPVILLTARTSLIFRIDGLETGADDYITKPFSPRLLRVRVQNLLENRQRLRERFVRTLQLEPREITVTSADETLLQQLLNAVEAHMGDVHFDVQALATEVGLSRTVLYTKAKALTNQTPHEFIQTLRLKRAAQLLKHPHLTVSEISYQVGFSDPKYFSKCFRKHFGQTPSQYAANPVKV